MKRKQTLRPAPICTPMNAQGTRPEASQRWRRRARVSVERKCSLRKGARRGSREVGALKPNNHFSGHKKLFSSFSKFRGWRKEHRGARRGAWRVDAPPHPRNIKQPTSGPQSRGSSRSDDGRERALADHSPRGDRRENKKCQQKELNLRRRLDRTLRFNRRQQEVDTPAGGREEIVTR